MRKALIYGILASFFFAFTFILNRSMNLSGGFWLWSACLRYLFTLPILAVMLGKSGGLMEAWTEMKKAPGPWVLWSTVGFGLFYAPLTFGSAFGESWLAADHCGRRSTDSSVGENDTGKESGLGICDTGWDFPAADPADEAAGRKGRGTYIDPYSGGSIFLSSGKQENYGDMSASFDNAEESVRHDPVQHALLAGNVRLGPAEGRSSGA